MRGRDAADWLFIGSMAVLLASCVLGSLPVALAGLAMYAGAAVLDRGGRRR